MPPPAEPKIHHIVHVDRLASIVADGALWSDAALQRRARPGTTIGMSSIKRRRLMYQLNSHRGLRVGECVPFYFCSRSIMLYVIHMANSPELDYRGGQGPIVHLEGRPARGGGLGRAARAAMGLHPLQRRLALFPGPLRSGATGRA